MRNLYRLAFAVTLTLVVPAQASSDGGVAFGPQDVRSMFHVAKSENQNQVHYALRLDHACRPVGKQPVFAYWRRLKRGVRVDEPLVGMGTRVYGASDEQKVERGAAGGRVQMHVKALDRVWIDVRVEKTPAGCKATPTTTLRGSPARLAYAFVQLGTFGLRVKYVDVTGYRASNGAKVTERFD